MSCVCTYLCSCEESVSLEEDERLKDLLEHYKRELDELNETIEKKKWLSSVHYLTDLELESSGVHRAARDVCDYLLEKTNGRA